LRLWRRIEKEGGDKVEAEKEGERRSWRKKRKEGA